MSSKAALKRQVARKAAMPEVKKLVKRYGRSTIANCLGQLRAAEVLKSKLVHMRAEIRNLSRRV